MPDRKTNREGKLLDALLESLVVPDFLLGGMTSNIISSMIAEALKKIVVTKEQQDNIYERVKVASTHLIEAGEILSELQNEINQQNANLEKLLSDIDDRRTEADRLGQIANMKQEEINAITIEFRNQLRQQLEKNKTRRRIFSCVIWAITLFVGGIVGFFVQKWLGSGISGQPH